MYRILLILWFTFLGFVQVYGQSPHGDSFKADCATCHTPTTWAINIDTFRFNHDTTNFALEGRHLSVDCKTCHTTLVFDEAPSNCISCHTDVHSMSAGNDCKRCHTSENWLVDNIPEIHEENGFPLIGAHDDLSCVDCHTSETHLRFGRNGNDCASCHMDDFRNTTSPDHETGNFSTNCIECHDPLRSDWGTDIISNHDFFPLTKGHNIEDCKQCHLTDNFEDASPECISCHQEDFGKSINPDHEELNLSTECASCHTTDLDWKPATFDIHDEYYPLNGAHAAIANECATCHNGDYNNTPNTCVGCHQTDYDNTSNPDHSETGFSTDCASCHNEETWSTTSFAHDTQYFPIYSGTHEGQWTDCLDCHTNPDNFADFTCITCHVNPETDEAHSAIGGYVYEDNACLACHPTGEKEAAFDHDATNFPLTGAHIGVDCLECHAEGFEGTSTACIDCHTEDFNASSNPNHTELGLSSNCTDCHTTEADWKSATFENHNDYYELVGEHAAIANDCVACHDGDYNNTPTTCVGCHQEDFNTSSNPSHTELNISTDCIECHKETTPEWKPARFNIHDEYYPLNGAHADIAYDCATCHNGDYNNTPNTCIGCHQEDYDNTIDPNHSQIGFSTNCTHCHNELAWLPTKFNHDLSFPIYSGTHEGEWNECIDCHFNPENYAEFTCVNCHINPETDNQHLGVGGYTYESTACLACHPTGDANDAFDHDATNFPLTGAHIGVECLECHSEGFEGTSTACVDCHTTDFNNSSNPNHTELNISTDCATCHTTEAGWSPASFDTHDNYYPLTGEHATIANECATCHNGDYNNTPNTCVGCHQTDFNESVNPNHTELNISTDCATCHTTEADWQPATFDIHDDYYPLNGAHAEIANDCATCHNGDYNNTPNTCVGCHQTDFDNTSNPNHDQAGFSTDCASCHNEIDWEAATFDHDSQYFPIYSGTHQGEWNACVDCHTNPDDYSLFSCIDCHEHSNKNEVDNDHNGVNGYVYESNACLACHPTGDSDSAFDHDATNFPLTGEHIGVACLDCHANGFQGTSTECVSCHQADFNNSSNPNHTELNISTDCATCHTTEADWQPASFDIHDDYYPLNGAHAEIANDCATCHNGDYNNTPNTCVGCHQTDFDNTSNPNHEQAGFSTDCASCHNEIDWEAATFDHDSQYFPIYSGTHQGEWNACVDCHTNPDDYSLFSCIDCHEHSNKNEVDDDHNGVNGYVYESNACLACHPTGDSDSAFDHDATNFPLTGEHIGVACLDCHANGFQGTSTECVSCHQIDFNNSSNPNHTELNISTDCATCHTTEADWQPASFDIHNDYYPLNGAHAEIANDCATCHNGDYNNTPNTCVGCHQTDFDNTSNPNHEQAGFSTDCASCHNEIDWEDATFDHDSQYFPIYSGTHQGEWNACVDCHTNPDDYSLFSCIDCHEHSNKKRSGR